MVVGFEMFTRRAQPVLDRWVAGEIDQHALVEQSGWEEKGSLPADLYFPLFHFSRMHDVRMLALNIERDTVTRISARGWQQLSASEREGVSAPAAAAPAYEEMLAAAYAEHAHQGDGEDHGRAERGFIDAQLAWDRAMAEALHAAANARPDALVIGVIGAGHLEHGYGVPHQLADLGSDDVATLLPWDVDRDCEDLDAGLADAVFGVTAPTAPHEAAPATLGVTLEVTADGVRVARVEPGSVAETAGVRAGDVIVAIAGSDVSLPADVRKAVGHRAPGASLTLRMRRDGKLTEIVATFPSEK
jgi:hypothetical protein